MHSLRLCVSAVPLLNVERTEPDHSGRLVRGIRRRYWIPTPALAFPEMIWKGETPVALAL
jgi:hypothetical protein